MRHAKSDWKQEGSKDFDRPLNDRGRDAADRVGHWIKKHHLEPEWVICSPAARTRETLALLRVHVPIPDTLIDFDDRLYLAEVPTLLAALARCSQDLNNVLVIGHNPGMEQLLEYLCGPDLPLSAKGKLMPTATLVQIAMPDDWRALAARSGKVTQIARPEDLA
jgi:phosphohistidine phosphatase